MAKSKFKSRLKAPTSEEAKKIVDKLDAAIKNHHGLTDTMEQAVGMYFLGRHFGWKVLYIIHSKSTIRKYESMLGIKVQEEFDPVGPDAERSYGWVAVQKISNFWKAVSGEVELGTAERRKMKGI